MKKVITKRRVNRSVMFFEALSKLIIDWQLSNEINTIALLKSGLYQSRCYYALSLDNHEKMHVVLSRKRDYVMKVDVDPSIESYLDSNNELKEIGAYFRKHFVCKKNDLPIKTIILESTEGQVKVLSRNAPTTF